MCAMLGRTAAPPRDAADWDNRRAERDEMTPPAAYLVGFLNGALLVLFPAGIVAVFGVKEWRW